MLLLLGSPAVARLLIRGWRLRSGQPPATAAAAAWRELAAVHRDLGREFPPGSPVEVVKAMEHGLPATTAAHLFEVAEAAQRSQFARETPPVDQLPGRVKLLVRELRGDTPAPRRLLAFLLPASLWRPRRAGGGKRRRKSR